MVVCEETKEAAVSCGGSAVWLTRCAMRDDMYEGVGRRVFHNNNMHKSKE